MVLTHLTPFAVGVNVRQVSCGNQHTAVLLESGEIFTFGRGNFGQLGQGASVTANVSTPQIVAALQVTCPFADAHFSVEVEGPGEARWEGGEE